MHLERVRLEPYGAFADRLVEFGSGLTVVVGPNESGKSTLLSAISDLLWGLTSRSHPMAFRVAGGQLRVSAAVRDPDGASRELVVTGRGCVSADGGPVDIWWTAGEIRTREAWLSALGLSRSALAEGGRAVLAGGGDLAPLLFRARTGIDLSAAADRLSSLAEDLFRAHRGNKRVAVRVEASEARDARKRADDAVSSAATVEQLRHDEAAAKATANKADIDFAAASEQKDGAEELRRAWAPAHDVHRLRDEVADLESQGRVLSGSDLLAFEEADAGLTASRRDLDGVDGRIATLKRRLGENAADQRVLAVGERVDELVKREPMIDRARKDREALTGIRREHRAAIRGGVVAAAPDRVAPLNAEGIADDALLDAAATLLLPADLVARIDDEADALRTADEAVRTERKHLLEARRDADEASTADDAGAADLVGSRRRRDEAWHAVRGPWLSGELPTDDERARAAQAVDDAHVDTDRSADVAIDSARGAGADEGRRAAHAEAVAARERRLEDAQAQQRSVRAGWERLLADAGVPEVLDPDSWQLRRAALDDLGGAISGLADASDEAARLDAYIAAFDRERDEVCAAAGQAGEALGWGALTERLLAARQAVRARDELERQIGDELQSRDECVASIHAHERVLSDLARPGDDLADVVVRSRAVVERTRDLQEAQGRVDAAARPDTNREELIRRAGGWTQADAEVAVASAEEALRRAGSARDDARQREREATDAREDAEREGDAATLNARAVEAAESLAGTVEHYLELLVASALVRRMAEREGPHEDEALLSNAARIARRLTAERVTDIVVDTGGGTAARLRVIADGLAEGKADELSEGTADQVFLALRLAGIREQQERSRQGGHVVLPVVLDDVLMAHDDERTELALRTLIDEARDQQIILTTHHGAVADVARRLGATVVELDPLPDQVADVAGPGRVARSRDDIDPGAVRAWARENGIPVSDRGRIAGHVVEAYLGRHAHDLEA